jgi:hypothetical protein
MWGPRRAEQESECSQIHLSLFFGSASNLRCRRDGEYQYCNDADDDEPRPAPSPKCHCAVIYYAKVFLTRAGVKSYYTTQYLSKQDLKIFEKLRLRQFYCSYFSAKVFLTSTD